MWIETGNHNTEHWLHIATQSSTVLQVCSMHWALFTSGNLCLTSNLSIAAGESFGAPAVHFKFDNDNVFDRHVDIIRGLVNAGWQQRMSRKLMFTSHLAAASSLFRALLWKKPYCPGL